VFNRQSVQSAIKSTQQRLKLYNQRQTKSKGLAIFCGVATDPTTGKGRLITVDLVPPSQPIPTFTYRCDKRFHTEILKTLLADEDEEKYGFLVLDGNGAVFATLQGSNRIILAKMSVELPNKHGRGGQSALRFARLRLEKRRAYLREVAERAAKAYLEGDRPNIKGLIVAGSAGLKEELLRSNLLDKRITDFVLRSIDISYGGERGLYQAIDQSLEIIGATKLLQERQILSKFMEEIHRDTGKYTFSVKDTIEALEMGAVGDLILWEGLKVKRYMLKNDVTMQEMGPYFSFPENKHEKPEPCSDHNTSTTLSVVKEELLVDWICDHYQDFGCKLRLVSDKSAVGSQFVIGFGGIGGILRWKVDFVGEKEAEFWSDNECDEDSDDDYGFDDGDYGF